MRIKVAKVGMEVVDKLTGIAYKIEATDSATNTEITKAEATEIIDEDETREPKKVTIDATNDRTFKVTKWVEDIELHSANIVNGILQVDGKDVVMGSIIAKNILKVFPGTVVLTAEAEDENEERDTVYEYSPSRDRFTKLGTIEKQVTVIEDSDTRVVYGFSFTKEIEVKDGDKVNKETVFDRAGIYVLTKGSFDFKALAADNASRKKMSYDFDFDEYEDEDEYDEDIDTSAIDGFLGFDFSKVVVAQGDKYFYIPQIDNEKDTTYVIFRITNRADNNGKIVMPGFLTAVTSNYTSARNLGKAIFSGEGFVKVDNVVIRSNELKDYIYLVDATRDSVNDVNTYVFATADRKLKKAVRKMTPDRGEIITIE